MQDEPPFAPLSQLGGDGAHRPGVVGAPPPPLLPPSPAPPAQPPSPALPAPELSAPQTKTSWQAAVGVVVGSVALGLVAGLIVAVVAFIIVLTNLASGSDPQSMGEGAAHGGYIVIAAGFWAVVAGVLAAIVATAASALLIIKLRRS